jgi:hypothetical protein
VLKRHFRDTTAFIDVTYDADKRRDRANIMVAGTYQRMFGGKVEIVLLDANSKHGS